MEFKKLSSLFVIMVTITGCGNNVPLSGTKADPFSFNIKVSDKGTKEKADPAPTPAPMKPVIKNIIKSAMSSDDPLLDKIIVARNVASDIKENVRQIELNNKSLEELVPKLSERRTILFGNNYSPEIESDSLFLYKFQSGVNINYEITKKYQDLIKKYDSYLKKLSNVSSPGLFWTFLLARKYDFIANGKWSFINAVITEINAKKAAERARINAEIRECQTYLYKPNWCSKYSDSAFVKFFGGGLEFNTRVSEMADDYNIDLYVLGVIPNIWLYKMIPELIDMYNENNFQPVYPDGVLVGEYISVSTELLEVNGVKTSPSRVNNEYQRAASDSINYYNNSRNQFNDYYASKYQTAINNEKIWQKDYDSLIAKNNELVASNTELSKYNNYDFLKKLYDARIENVKIINEELSKTKLEISKIIDQHNKNVLSHKKKYNLDVDNFFVQNPKLKGDEQYIKSVIDILLYAWGLDNSEIQKGNFIYNTSKLLWKNFDAHIPYDGTICVPLASILPTPGFVAVDYIPSNSSDNLRNDIVRIIYNYYENKKALEILYNITYNQQIDDIKRGFTTYIEHNNANRSIEFHVNVQGLTKDLDNYIKDLKSSALKIDTPFLKSFKIDSLKNLKPKICEKNTGNSTTGTGNSTTSTGNSTTGLGNSTTSTGNSTTSTGNSTTGLGNSTTGTSSTIKPSTSSTSSTGHITR